MSEHWNRNVVLTGAQYRLIEGALAEDNVDLLKVSTYLFAVFVPPSRGPAVPMIDEERRWEEQARVLGADAAVLTRQQWAVLQAAIRGADSHSERARDVLRAVAGRVG